MNTLIYFYIIGYLSCFIFMYVDSMESKIDFDMKVTGIFIASFLSWILLGILIYGKLDKEQV